MKRKILFLLIFLGMIAALTFAFTKEDREEKLIQREVKASSKQQKELERLTEELLRIYNRGGEKALRRLFPYGEKELKIQKLENDGNCIVDESISYLKECGGNVGVRKIQCFVLEGSEKYSYAVSHLNSGDKLKICYRKNDGKYSVVWIRKI